MSIRVELPDLERALDDHDYAFLAVQGGDRPHVLAVRVTGTGERLEVSPTGSTAARRVVDHPGVTLVLPAREPGGRSLIVDADVVATGEGTMALRPVGAVLHRPA